MRSGILLLAIILISGYTLPAQVKEADAIKKSDAVRYMRYLSSDELQGRRTGSEGNDSAAAYISKTALSLGVKPLPGMDNLFQTLSFIKVTPQKDSTCITVTDTLGNEKHQSLITPVMTPSDNVTLSGDVVFAGYGYNNVKAGYNDFGGVSVTDKIVIIMTRVPDLEGTGLPLSGDAFDEMTETRKLPLLMLHRAKAILFVADPAIRKESDLNSFQVSSSYRLVPLFKQMMPAFSLNAYIIGQEAVNKMLESSGETLKSLQDKIAMTKRSVSFVLPQTKAEISIRVEKDTVTSSNIVGYIEGSDPQLKNEYIMYTAHYDHSGTDSKGRVLNGANDNASGSIGLLNVATAFASLEKKPLRSIVFLWTTGEEEGLYGSSYYVDNPLLPLENTIADINFDMIARSRLSADAEASLSGKTDITGRDTIKVISDHDYPGVLSVALESCSVAGIYGIDEGKGTHFSGSDHYPFYRKGIPVLFFFTGLHHDYHKYTDDFEFIDFQKLVKVSKAGFLTGYRLANDSSRPVKAESKE